MCGASPLFRSMRFLAGKITISDHLSYFFRSARAQILKESLE